MKKLCTLLVAIITVVTLKSQVLLNEIYTNPGAGSHEFFELFNNSSDSLPVDGYSLVTYFEEGSKKGFYVLDFPNLTIASKGFFVGSSRIPFNYQGNTNVTKSDFCWNDNSFRNGSTGGYLKKWVIGTKDLSDGNPNYDEESVPLSLNDFFVKKSGNGASYNSFLYKDGILVNSFVGGSGDSTTLPTFIRNMPLLSFTTTNNSITSNYFIDSSSYTTGIAEYVVQDAGSDNGFIRRGDGMCAAWEKSSSQAFHTPQTANGGSLTAGIGALTITTHIGWGTNGDSSYFSYDIISGPTYMFPVELSVYADNGTVAGQWDASDAFLDSNVENIIDDGPFTTSFAPDSLQLILVAKTAVGCYDRVRLVLQPNPDLIVLPVKLKSFTAKPKDDYYLLEWDVLNNQEGNSFELEKSTDGRAFRKVNTIAATDKIGEEYYTYAVPLAGQAYYRLKIINNDKRTSYSNIVYTKSLSSADKIILLQNPVSSSVRLMVQIEEAAIHSVSVFNTAGVKLISRSYVLQKGLNTIMVDLGNSFPIGSYILEVATTGNRSIKRFIKR